jgi:hypothetical protein
VASFSSVGSASFSSVADSRTCAQTPRVVHRHLELAGPVNSAYDLIVHKPIDGCTSRRGSAQVYVAVHKPRWRCTSQGGGAQAKVAGHKPRWRGTSQGGGAQADATVHRAGRGHRRRELCTAHRTCAGPVNLAYEQIVCKPTDGCTSRRDGAQADATMHRPRWRCTGRRDGAQGRTCAPTPGLVHRHSDLCSICDPACPGACTGHRDGAQVGVAVHRAGRVHRHQDLCLGVGSCATSGPAELTARRRARPGTLCGGEQGVVARDRVWRVQGYNTLFNVWV